jgi:hypothetical protein
MDIQITFRVNPETIYKEISTEEWEAMERAQDGKPRIYQLRPILARFVVGPDGNLLSQERGMESMRAIPIHDFLNDVFPAFFKTLSEGAVPKGNATQLASRSEASTAPTTPAGSQS